MTPSSPTAPATRPGKTYVLVHGGYHGAWCWKYVAADLRSRGHDVHTPTQTGLGERSHLIAYGPTMDTFIQDVTQVIEYEDLDQVILVGHSFAGQTIAGVADRMPERLRHLVFLDAQILRSGESAADRSPELVEGYRQKAMATSNGVSIPPSEPEQFGVTDPEMAAWVKRKLTPHPLQTYYDKLILRHPFGNGVPSTYIACTRPTRPSVAEARSIARSTTGWTYLELATGHDAMLTMPGELTEILAVVDGP